MIRRLLAMPGFLASFHAIGSFVEPNTTLINRLAAIPEVLSYENGKIIDVKSGQKLD